MNAPGQPPKQLSNQEVVQLIQQQQQTIKQFEIDKNNMQTNMLSMQEQLINIAKQMKELEKGKKIKIRIK